MSDDVEEVTSEEITLSDGEYFLNEGVKAEGGVPDWYQSDHFKNVSEQAKSYSELQKKFGGFTGAPKDGYSSPEGFDSEDDMLKTFTEYAQSINMNQEAFNKGFELLTTQSEVSQEVSAELEMKKLGDNADERIAKATQFLENNLSEDKFNEIKSFVTTAEAVNLVEMLIPATASKGLAGGATGETKITLDEVNEAAFKKDEHGNLLRSIDPVYDKKILGMYAKLHQ